MGDGGLRVVQVTRELLKDSSAWLERIRSKGRFEVAIGAERFQVLDARDTNLSVELVLRKTKMREVREHWAIEFDRASRMLPFVVRHGGHVQACFANEGDAKLFVQSAIEKAQEATHVHS